MHAHTHTTSHTHIHCTRSHHSTKRFWPTFGSSHLILSCILSHSLISTYPVPRYPVLECTRTHTVRDPSSQWVECGALLDYPHEIIDRFAYLGGAVHSRDLPALKVCVRACVCACVGHFPPFVYLGGAVHCLDWPALRVCACVLVFVFVCARAYVGHFHRTRVVPCIRHLCCLFSLCVWHKRVLGCMEVKRHPRTNFLRLWASPTLSMPRPRWGTRPAAGTGFSFTA